MSQNHRASITTVLVAVADHWFHGADDCFDFMNVRHQLWHMWYTRELEEPLLVVELEKLNRVNMPAITAIRS